MNKCCGLSSWASSHKQPSKAFKQKHEVIAGGGFHRARGDDDKQFTKLQDTVLLQMLLNDDDAEGLNVLGCRADILKLLNVQRP